MCFGIIKTPRKKRNVSFYAGNKWPANNQEILLLVLRVNKIVIKKIVIGNKMRISYEIEPGFANTLAFQQFS